MIKLNSKTKPYIVFKKKWFSDIPKIARIKPIRKS